jgi:ribonuclease-3
MPGAARDLGELEELLGHRFRRRELLERALTHPSLQEDEDYERLEFLGDAVLDLAIAELLFERMPDRAEGELTEMRSLLVSRRTLAEVGTRLRLGDWLRYGGNLAGRDSLPRSVLGNVVEALLAAVYLDLGRAAGLEHCRRLAEDWLAPEMADIAGAHGRAHAKQALQEWAQAHGHSLPRYPVLDTHEHPEAHAFQVAVEVAGRTFPAAWGRSKREAEKRAAWEALLVLRVGGSDVG